jgi:hypothetical protein
MNYSERYLSRNVPRTNPMTHLQRPCSAAVGASSTIEECSPSVEIPPCRPSCWRYNREVCKAHHHVLQPCLGSCAIRGTKELEKFDLLKFTVNATSTDQSTWWNLSEYSHSGLISVQMANQCLGHVLKRSHHSDYITNCYLLLSENLLVSHTHSGIIDFSSITRGSESPRYLQGPSGS